MKVTDFIFRALAATTFMGLSACAAPTSGVTGPPGTVLALVPTESTDSIDSLFRDSCRAQKGAKLVVQGRSNLRCDTPATPQDTASLLLTFEGTLEDLPVLSLQQAIQRTAQDRTISLVSIKFFARVPQEKGQALRIVPSSSRFITDMRKVLQEAGAVVLVSEDDVGPAVRAINLQRALEAARP